MTLSKFLTSAAVAALLTGAASAQDTTTEGNADMAAETEQSTGMTDTGTGTSTGMSDSGTGYAEGEQMAEAPKSIEEMTVGQVIGRSVVDPEGNTIGEIDYVIEQPEGVAGVIGIGGFLGLGEYTVAIQMDEFDYSPEQTTLMLDTDKETLKERPEFDESGAESLPDDTQMSSLMSGDSDVADDGGSDMSGSDDGAAASTDMEEGADTETDAAADTDAASEDEAAAEEGAATEEDGASAEDPAADTEQDAAADTETEQSDESTAADENMEEETDADQS